MRKALIDSMRGQMTPSPAARAALAEKLARVRPRAPKSPVWRYGAAAACAALAVGGFSLYRAIQPRYMPATGTIPIHSYVSIEGSGLVGSDNRHPALSTGNTAAGATEQAATTSGQGDRDMDMAPEDLAEKMAGYGFTPEEIQEYQSIGCQMTWAKWWRFVHQTQDAGTGFTLDALKEFSRRELAVNTGALPGGAYIGDAPSQEEAVNAYQALMAHFNGQYPDWYGGAYIDGSGWLVVLLVSDKDPGDKTLELQVLDWTGSDRVAFRSARYSFAQLRELMDQLNRLPDTYPECGAVMAGWGIDEENNRIELTLTEDSVQILVILAQLDPADDMIQVLVGQRAAADVGTESPAVSHKVQPGGVTTDSALAVEPFDSRDGVHYGVWPEQSQPASVQDTPAYSPGT